MLPLAASAFLLAWPTWVFIEQPFRRRDAPLLGTRRKVLVASCAASAVFLAIGIAGVWTNGFENRLTPQQRVVLRYADYPFEAFYREGTCMLTAGQTYRDIDPACWQTTSRYLIGDSFAGALSAGIAPDRGIGTLAQTACPPVMDFPVFNQPTCLGINTFRFAEIEKAKADVILHAAWSEYWYRRGFQDQFGKSLAHLSQAGGDVVIIGNIPRFFPNLPELVVKTGTALVPGSMVKVHIAELRKVNEDLRKMAEQHGVRFWDPLQVLCRDDICAAVIALQEGDFPVLDVALMSFDNGHMTYSGAAYVAGLFLDDPAD